MAHQLMQKAGIEEATTGAGATSRHQASLSDARVWIETGDALDVRHFEVKESMSSLFEVKVVVVSDNPDIDFESAVGQPMRFMLSAGSSRTWTGVCKDLQQVRVEDHYLSTYELTLVPSLWLTTQRRNHRMFQHASEIEIVTKLLAEWNIHPVLRLNETYKKRKYRVQYGETDHAFMSRMLEDVGVSYYFTCDAETNETRLVLDDAPQRNEARASIPFRDVPNDTKIEYVTGVHVGRRVRPGKYTLRDHDYRRPAKFDLAATASGSGDVEDRLERYHYVPGAFLFEGAADESTPTADDKGSYRADLEAGRALAQRRLGAQRASARETTFRTNTIDLGPGVVLSLLDHPKSELASDKPMLIVESTFSGEMPGKWKHECKAVSASAPYQPELRAPKPRVSGVESATVVGPPGEEIHTDEFGRVRVHFHWDRESEMNEDSSCWMHVSQSWSGSGYGGSNLPRIGQEVIVDFLGGDPDRPIIVGRVYTNLQKTPYSLPANKTQSGWKSYSSPATGGFNEIMFEDSAGTELLRMQAEKNLEKLVKNDEDTTIGNDRSSKIGGNEAQSVGKNFVKQVMENAMEMVGMQKHTQAGQLISIVCGKSSITMTADGVITIKGTKIAIEGQDHVQVTSNQIDLN